MPGFLARSARSMSIVVGSYFSSIEYWNCCPACRPRREGGLLVIFPYPPDFFFFLRRGSSTISILYPWAPGCNPNGLMNPSFCFSLKAQKCF